MHSAALVQQCSARFGQMPRSATVHLEMPCKRTDPTTPEQRFDLLCALPTEVSDRKPKFIIFTKIFGSRNENIGFWHCASKFILREIAFSTCFLVTETDNYDDYEGFVYDKNKVSIVIFPIFSSPSTLAVFWTRPACSAPARCALAGVGSSTRMDSGSARTWTGCEQGCPPKRRVPTPKRPNPRGR